MKYIDLYEKFKNLPFININDVKTAFPDFDNRRLNEWQKAGYIKKIIRNFHVFADKTLDGQDLCFIANKLREPSYISLEYALNHYSLIPEAVFVYTSITTKKTASFETVIGNFSYQTLKRSLFFGYVLQGQEKAKYQIAEPEKAILDFLYLRTDIKDENDIESLRLNADVYKEIVNEDKLREYLAAFELPILDRKVALLMKYIKKYD